MTAAYINATDPHETISFIVDALRGKSFEQQRDHEMEKHLRRLKSDLAMIASAREVFNRIATRRALHQHPALWVLLNRTLPILESLRHIQAVMHMCDNRAQRLAHLANNGDQGALKTVRLCIYGGAMLHPIVRALKVLCSEVSQIVSFRISRMNAEELEAAIRVSKPQLAPLLERIDQEEARKWEMEKEEERRKREEREQERQQRQESKGRAGHKRYQGDETWKRERASTRKWRGSTDSGKDPYRWFQQGF